ncbi:cobalamin biosynthesis protein [Pseudomonas sp. NA-150]|uniref:cobalamin biosynthesis protein n=1 Tax=Pseudomonas sp. NA-150 TaxID=3367525 RepID=UPI0037C913DB
MPSPADPPLKQPTRVVGIGCQRGCCVDELRQLIEQGLHAHGLHIGALTALASINQKSTEPGLLALAAQLQLPLVFFSATELAVFETRLSHRSDIAFAHTGCYGVAESTALALAQQLSGAVGDLLITRQKSRRATFALAGEPTNRR